MPTNAEVIGDGLVKFASLEDYQQEIIADYIECPNASDCSWDGDIKHMDVCTECKRKWLEREWEG